MALTSELGGLLDGKVDSPSKASRIQRGKSRQGCRQCRTRRVKCDESRPRCSNCSRNGLQCPGYIRELRWSNKHQPFHGGYVVPASTSVSENEGAPQSQIAACSANTAWATTRVLDDPITVVGKSVVVQEREREDLRARQQTCSTATSSSLVQTAENDILSYWSDPDGLHDSGERAHFASCLDAPAMHYDRPDVVLDSPIAQDARASLLRVEDYNIFRNPVDLPTTLVEYWFSHICEMWSTFDSEVNRNRQIASDTWTTSEAVFCTLQAMSAACLVDTMPILKRSLPSLFSQAIAVIGQRMLVLPTLPDAEAGKVAIDLVFAVFALGTSVHWADSSQLGISLLNHARNLLGLWDSSCDLDTFPRAYFQQALIYWEMLLSIVNSNPGHVKLDQRRRKYQDRLRLAMGIGGDGVTGHIVRSPLPESPEAFHGTRPNSWCGISSEVIEVFGQTLALYRTARERQRQGKASTAAASCDAVCDIGIAHELQRELLAMDFDNTVRSDELLGFSLHTGDQKTPLCHLRLIAEAYHLASLLQLYLAFDDLDIEPLRDHACFAGSVTGGVSDGILSETTSRSETLVILALKLIKLLEQIPAESGSRCMQPVLYISAAAALKSETQPMSKNFLQTTNTLVGVTLDECMSMSNLQRGDCPTPYQCNSQMDQTLFDSPFLPEDVTSTITQASLEISKARHFIMKRLTLLEQTLPSRPMGVATNLVKAIWATYDGDNLGLEHIHWLDIMMDTGLQTLFR